MAAVANVVELKDYQDDYNVLFPQQTLKQISPFHRTRVEIVQINSDPKGGEVYKVGSRKVGKNKWENVLSLGKSAIMKLSTAAGIVWNWNETKPIQIEREYVLYQAVGAMRKPSGEWIPLKAIKEIDLEVIEIETLASNLEKATKLEKEKPADLKGLSPEEWAKQKTKANMIQWKKNKVMRAETGAMLRVVRALLSIKHQYSPIELSKPFAVPTVDFSPDYSDPEVRRMIASEGVRAVADLFGSGNNVSQISTTPNFHQEIQSEVFDVTDIGGLGEELDTDMLPVDPIEKPKDEIEDSTNPDGTKTEPLPSCAECGAVISEKVHDYSVRRHNRPLCYNCQKAENEEQGGKSA